MFLTELSIKRPVVASVMSLVLVIFGIVTFNEISPGDIVYCDPPYVPLSITSSFTSYSKNDFNIKDQEDLARNAELLQTKGILCIISNHDLEVTRELYAKSKIFELKVQRNIASKSSSRIKVGEIIAVF